MTGPIMRLDADGRVFVKEVRIMSPGGLFKHATFQARWVPLRASGSHGWIVAAMDQATPWENEP